jgi:hypothetical protein
MFSAPEAPALPKREVDRASVEEQVLKCSLGLSLFPSARRGYTEGQEGVSMSDRDRVAQADGEHGHAVQRLKSAVFKQSRLRDAHEAAKDTPDELAVDAALHVADGEVAARERWLKSVDDHDY